MLPSHYGAPPSYAAAAGSSADGCFFTVQPLFGHFADRLSKPWFIPTGPDHRISALTGVVPTYRPRPACGCRRHRSSGVSPKQPYCELRSRREQGDGHERFGIGAGWICHRTFLTALLLWWGLNGTLFLPPGRCRRYFIARLPVFAYLPSAGRKRPGFHGEMIDIFPPASSVVFAVRSSFTIEHLYPALLINVLHQSNAAGGTALTIFYCRRGRKPHRGRLADTFGLRAVIRYGFAGSSLFCPFCLDPKRPCHNPAFGRGRPFTS
jgi:hypothetical protein